MSKKNDQKQAAQKTAPQEQTPVKETAIKVPETGDQQQVDGGEITPEVQTGVGTVVQQDETAKIEVPQEKVETVISEDAAGTRAMREQLKAEGAAMTEDKNNFVVIAGNVVSNYAAAMAPSMSRTRQEAAIQQVSLLDTYVNSLKLLDTDMVSFNETMMAILKVIHEHREGAFSETMALRCTAFMRAPEKRVRLFEELTHLFLEICDPANRKPELAKVIDLDSAFQECGLDDDVRSKLIAWVKRICRIA